MRDLINIIDEATLSANQIDRYPERFDAFIAHIQDGKPFYTEKDGTEVILNPAEADRFLKLKAQGQFKGALKGIDLSGNSWPLSGFRKTAEFGGASAKPGDDSETDLSKEGVLLKPVQIGITDRDIPANQLASVIAGNEVLASTAYGQTVADIAKSLGNNQPGIVPKELVKQEQLRKAIVDYAGEYLGVIALVQGQSEFPNRGDFLEWLGGKLGSVKLNFPSKSNTQIADSFASITNPTTQHQINISSKGTGGGAAPSLSGLVIPDHLRKKRKFKTALDLIELCQTDALPKPKTISQVYAVMNLLYERMPEKVPSEFHKFLPWPDDITARVSDSLKNGTPMPKYVKLFQDLQSRGSDGGKLTYVVKAAVMDMVNDGAIPEFQAAILEILDYNFIQQYTSINNKTGELKFETQWPAKLNGVVTLETKSGGTDPTKGGFSFKLKPKGSKASMPPPPSDEVIAKVGGSEHKVQGLRPKGAKPLASAEPDVGRARRGEPSPRSKR
jgi:hypothetical protein